MEQERSHFWTCWEETCRPQFEFHLCERTVSKMHLPGLNPVWNLFFFPISPRPVYSQWGSLSEADRLCLFSCSHIQFQTQCRASRKIRFPAFDFAPQRVKGYDRPGLPGVGWGISWEPSSECDTRPFLGGSGGSLFHMDTMFVFTKHFRGKISPIWAEEAEYPYGLRLPVNMRQNNDSSSQRTSSPIDFLALMWHPVLLMNNCCPERKIKSLCITDKQ